MEITMPTNPRLIAPLVVMVFWLYCFVRMVSYLRTGREPDWRDWIGLWGTIAIMGIGAVVGIIYFAAAIICDDWTLWS